MNKISVLTIILTTIKINTTIVFNNFTKGTLSDYHYVEQYNLSYWDQYNYRFTYEIRMIILLMKIIVNLMITKSLPTVVK